VVEIPKVHVLHVRQRQSPETISATTVDNLCIRR
jgi:hypothetical protein